MYSKLRACVNVMEQTEHPSASQVLLAVTFSWFHFYLKAETNGECLEKANVNAVMSRCTMPETSWTKVQKKLVMDVLRFILFIVFHCSSFFFTLSYDMNDILRDKNFSDNNLGLRHYLNAAIARQTKCSLSSPLGSDFFPSITYFWENFNRLLLGKLFIYVRK